MIRLARLLDLPESEEGLYTPIVLTKCNNQRVGCLVDEVHRIVAIPESDVLPLTGQQVAGTAFNLEGGFVPVIDVAEILLEQERQALEQWREVEQERLRELETVQG